ncbi:MAG TPA: hypothetical protein VK832_10965, partial [Burkholderiaceae bacterium]|nr:hypothetical protein [Burkholderiaceae bacterium]
MNIENAILKEQARAIHHSLLPSIVSGGIFALVFVAVFGTKVSNVYSAVFLTVLAALTAFNFLLWKAFRRATYSPAGARRLLCLASIGYALTSILWGIAVYLFFPADRSAQQMALFLAVLMAGTTSIFSLGYYYPAFLAAVMPMGVLNTLIIGWQGPIIQSLFICLVAFIPIITVYAWRFNQIVITSLRLRFENISLIDH